MEIERFFIQRMKRYGESGSPCLRLLGIYIGCTIAKTNIHDCDVGCYVPT